MNKLFTSVCCGGEVCSMCGKPAGEKVEEAIFHDDPRPYRHPLTAYLCHEHFSQIMDRGGYRTHSPEVTQLLEAVLGYGRHTRDCDLSWKGAKHNPQCTCGWNNLRDSLAPFDKTEVK